MGEAPSPRRGQGANPGKVLKDIGVPVDQAILCDVENGLHGVAQDIGGKTGSEPGDDDVLCLVAVLVLVDQ
ncbi:hypothetical protein D3C85_1819940 [compost metagenome]